MEKLKISGKEAERTYDLLMDPGFGFTPDARFDLEGFNNALALRAEIQRQTGGAPALYRPRLLRAGDEAGRAVNRDPSSRHPASPGPAAHTFCWVFYQCVLND